MAEIVQDLIGEFTNTVHVSLKEDQVETVEKVSIVEIYFREDQNPSADKYSKHNY